MNTPPLKTNLILLQAPIGYVSSHIRNQNSSNRFKNLSYSTCEHVWSYLGKIVLLTRSLLNVAVRNDYIVSLAGNKFPQAIKHTITQMKLFSIIGVSFSLVNLNSTVRKIFNSFLLYDREGIALGTLSFTVITADVIDSVTTFINASLVLSQKNPVEAFSAMGLPLGFTMVGLGTISRTIQIAKTANLYRNIDKENFVESDLNKILPPEASQPLRSSKTIKQLLIKKLQMDTLGIIANLFILSALAMFTLGVVTAFPHVLKSVSYTIRLATLYHQDQKI